MRRLKQAEIASVRASMLIAQKGYCAVCQLPLSAKEAVLDHDHRTGICRGVLHAGCNSLLGPVENNAPRFGVRNLQAFLHGAAAYLKLHEQDMTQLLHPTYRTEDEKRLRRNKKARVARAKKKVSDAAE